MPTLGLIVVFSIIGSVLSLAGGVLLLTSRRVAERVARPLSAFAAGVLLTTALVDVLPEAIARASASAVLSATLAGFLTFLVMEMTIRHLVRHRRSHASPAAPLMIVGDTVHNFVDGVVIAGTFLVDVKLGIVTSLAVAAHEVPQEIGDFAVLLQAGMSRRRVLLVNLWSAMATMVGAVSSYAVGESVQRLLPAILGITAGFFLYLTASNLIPEMQRGSDRPPVLELAMLLAGTALVLAMNRF